MIHTTVHKRTARRIVATAASVIAFGATAIGYAGHAQADYAPGCERIVWGFMMSGYRTICDGPRHPDGSWDRTRREWTPGGNVPYRVNCGGYSCWSSGGYYRAESTQRFDMYPVTDDTVLPNEPGWLPAGSVVIR
jgi:hypothetical protein